MEKITERIKQVLRFYWHRKYRVICCGIAVFALFSGIHAAKGSRYGSAALSLLGDVLTTYGPDTFTGVAASIMLGSTETIFYTIALYFGTVGIRRTRAALPAALISSVIGTAAAIVLAQGLFA